MNYIKSFLVLLIFTSVTPKFKKVSPIKNGINTENRVIIVTLDGFRWKELFMGADSTLLHNTKFTTASQLAEIIFWDKDVHNRRLKLMPFFWNVIAKKGALYGNRNFKNEVNVSNSFGISYPGYNEMFTGQPDDNVNSNDRIWNERENVFENLSGYNELKGSFAAFTSWDVFPYILNSKRNGLFVNSNNTQQINNDQNNDAANCLKHNKHCRKDMVTYFYAMDYLEKYKPSIFYLALGETDEYAHKGDYFNYLQKAKEADHIIEELWYYIQTDTFYKNKTTLIITTDHGRGNGNSWINHGSNIKGSSQIWMAAIGNQVAPIGEGLDVKDIKQKQLAATIADLFGTKFGDEDPIKFVQ